MKFVLSTLLIVFLFGISLQYSLAQGKIGSIEEELDNPSSTYSEDNNEDQKGDDNTLGEQLVDDATNSILEGCGYAIAGLIVETSLEKEWDAEYDHTRSVQDYPFKNKFDGRYTRDPETKRPVAFDLGINIFDDGRDLTGGVLEGRFFINRYVSVDGKYQVFEETVKTATDTITNSMNISDVNISYHRLAFTHIDLWYGLGANFLSIKEKQYGGANFNIGTEIFIPPLFSLGTSWQFGFLDDLSYTNGNAFFKVHLRRFLLDVGYQKYEIGQTTIEGVKTGLGWHF